MSNEKPKWERGDTIKSIKGVVGLGKIAIARTIGYLSELPERIDTHYANSVNGGDDE